MNHFSFHLYGRAVFVSRWLTAIGLMAFPAGPVEVFSADAVRIQRILPDSSAGRSAAVRVFSDGLVHTTQLIAPGAPGNSEGSQSAAVLKQLDVLLAEYLSSRGDVVKLNVYVRAPQVRDKFWAQLAMWSGTELPAVAYVVTPLPDSTAEIAIDAVFVSRLSDSPKSPSRHFLAASDPAAQPADACLLPAGDVIYVSGQAEPGDLAAATRATLGSLLRTLQHLQLDRQHIVQLKCFLQPMSEIATVNCEISEFFDGKPVPPISHVEWISGSRPIEIELVAWAPAEASAEKVSFVTPPWMKSSPVFSRVARIHGNDRIYVSGLFAAQTGSAETQVRAVFTELERILGGAGSDLRHLAKATYYVADDETSGQLNRLRPEFYDPARPPAASKAMVSGVGITGQTMTMDMIAAPVADAANKP